MNPAAFALLAVSEAAACFEKLSDPLTEIETSLLRSQISRLSALAATSRARKTGTTLTDNEFREWVTPAQVRRWGFRALPSDRTLRALIRAEYPIPGRCFSRVQTDHIRATLAHLPPAPRGAPTKRSRRQS